MRMLMLLCSLALAGCVTVEEVESHRASVAAWERVEVARAQSLGERFKALQEVARRGDTTALVAVAFSVNGSTNPQGVSVSQLPAPPDSEARAYRWASLVLPTATAITAGYFGYKLGTVQSDNSRLQAVASYDTMGTLGTSGLGTTRDVALAGYTAIGAMPPSSVTTTTRNVTIGAGATAAWEGGTANMDFSHRCSGSWSNPLTTGAGITNFNPGQPYNC